MPESNPSDNHGLTPEAGEADVETASQTPLTRAKLGNLGPNSLEGVEHDYRSLEAGTDAQRDPALNSQDEQAPFQFDDGRRSPVSSRLLLPAIGMLFMAVLAVGLLLRGHSSSRQPTQTLPVAGIPTEATTPEPESTPIAPATASTLLAGPPASTSAFGSSTSADAGTLNPQTFPVLQVSDSGVAPVATSTDIPRSVPVAPRFVALPLPPNPNRSRAGSVVAAAASTGVVVSNDGGRGPSSVAIPTPSATGNPRAINTAVAVPSPLTANRLSLPTGQITIQAKPQPSGPVATAICSDASIIYAGSPTGMCSTHGGVAIVISRP